MSCQDTFHVASVFPHAERYIPMHFVQWVDGSRVVHDAPGHPLDGMTVIYEAPEDAEKIASHISEVRPTIHVRRGMPVDKFVSPSDIRRMNVR